MRTGFLSRVLGKKDKVDRQVLLDCLSELAEERELLSLIFDNMTEGVLVFDSQRNLRFANPRAGELLDFDPTSALYKEVTTFLRHKEFVETLERTLDTGKEVSGVDALTVFEGRPAALRLETTPLLDSTHLSGGALVFVWDVTEEKKRKAEQRETKRLGALATLSASLAHEIRNPLNSMGIHAQLLRRRFRDEEGNEEVLKSLDVIGEEIRNLNDKLTGFIDAARPRQPQFEEVALHELLEETLNLMRPELEQSGIVPEYYPPTVHTIVYADRVDLRKACVNILKNSVEAMSEGGRLIIRIRVEPKTVRLTFEDTGTGMEEETLERIFEIGYSAKDSGSGLGMAQVERCVREHRGDIRVTSDEGEGTRVVITMPVLSQGKKMLEMTPVDSSPGNS